MTGDGPVARRATPGFLDGFDSRQIHPPDRLGTHCQRVFGNGPAVPPLEAPLFGPGTPFPTQPRTCSGASIPAASHSPERLTPLIVWALRFTRPPTPPCPASPIRAGKAAWQNPPPASPALPAARSTANGRANAMPAAHGTASWKRRRCPPAPNRWAPRGRNIPLTDLRHREEPAAAPRRQRDGRTGPRAGRRAGPGVGVLVGGDPGIGKSTLLLQAVASFARKD
jgi:hypothetical protein